MWYHNKDIKRDITKDTLMKVYKTMVVPMLGVRHGFLERLNIQKCNLQKSSFTIC
jgi:hypothetical protein